MTSISMSLSITWEIEGEKQLVRRLQGIEATAKDWKPAFKKATDELVKVFSNEVFATQGRAVQETWPPLKPSYLAQKRKQGFTGGTLVKTGKMQKSFKSLVKADYAKVWNSVAYFQYHQSNKPRNKIPRRVMMKLGHQQREIVVKAFHEHFKKSLK